MDAKETSFYTAVLIISIVLGIVIVYFIVSILRQQRRNVALYRKSLLTEMTTLEKERSRIASDLHDEIGPMLSAVKLRLSSLDVASEEDQEQLESTGNHIDELIRRMREISFDLMPNTLIRKGLTMAITEFIQYCSKRNSMHISFNSDNSVALDEQRTINLYRIVQEIVHNAMKHAKASELKIELRREKNNIILATHDNGVGFNYDVRLSDATGLGLRNLLSRTEIMGGKMYIESKKDKGTTYIFEIPVQYD
jgi:signal transduction histidine kinase